MVPVCWFVERLWRSVKYEDIGIKGYEWVPDLEAGLSAYFRFYDEERPLTNPGPRTVRSLGATSLIK